MKPIRLSLSNFQSYRGDHEIDFADLNLAVLSGPNGSGKSSIIDAIRYALWGMTRSGADSIVTEGENVGRVEFEFALGEDRYIVSRQRSRKGAGSTTLSFELAGGWEQAPQILDGKTVAETQQKIEHLLRMTDELFTQTACANQGNAAAFSQAKPAQRKQVLGEILDLAEWERRAEAARAASRDVDSQMLRLNGDMGAAQIEAERQPEIEAEIASNADDLAIAERERDGVRGDLATAQQQRVAALARQEESARKRREIETAQAQLDQAKRAIAEREVRLRNLQQVMVGHENVAAALGDALAAEERAEALANAQRQDLELAHQEQIIAGRAVAAKREHEAEIARVREALKIAKREYDQELRALDVEVAHIREAHLHRVAQFNDRYERLARQVELLESVPCANLTEPASIRDALVSGCPLIASAREAEARIGAVYADLTTAQAACPWADKQAELEALRTQASEIGAPEATQLRELERIDPLAALRADSAALAERRANLGYVAGSWEEARRQAEKRPALEQQAREIEAAAAQAGEVQAALDEARRAAADLGEHVQQIKSGMLDLAAIARNLADLDREIARCEGAIREAEQAISAAQARAGALQERLAAAKRAGERIGELQRDLGALEQRRQILDLLGNPRSGAFSRSGIPALLIDQAVPELEAAANEVLGELSDGRMSLALRTQRETQAKTLTETLDIIVADDRGERPYETFSGGEAMRVDLGLRIGLSQLLARRAGARCELLVLDEVAAPLDAEGRRLFVDCLARVAQRFATVLCISHTEDIKDLFPARLEISKNADGSRVEVLQ